MDHIQNLLIVQVTKTSNRSHEKNDNNCSQYAVTLALNYEKI